MFTSNPKCHCDKKAVTHEDGCSNLGCTNRWSYTLKDLNEIKRQCPVHGESHFLGHPLISGVCKSCSENSKTLQGHNKT